MQVQDFHAYEYDGVTYDCGDKVGLLRANVAYALKHPEFGEAAREAVAALLDEMAPPQPARVAQAR